jgi:hypothetical protein
MAPGTRVEIKREWWHTYRRPGAKVRGTVVSQSPSGAVTRVRMDGLGDSYLCTNHLSLTPD